MSKSKRSAQESTPADSGGGSWRVQTPGRKGGRGRTKSRVTLVFQVEVTRSRSPERGGEQDTLQQGRLDRGAPAPQGLVGGGEGSGSYPELSGSPWVGWRGGPCGATCSCSSPEKLPAPSSAWRTHKAMWLKVIRGRGPLPSSEALEAAVGGHPGWTPDHEPWSRVPAHPCHSRGILGVMWPCTPEHPGVMRLYSQSACPRHQVGGRQAQLGKGALGTLLGELRIGGNGQPWSPVAPATPKPVLRPVGKSSSHHQDAHRSGLQWASRGAWPGSWAQSRQRGKLLGFWGQKFPRVGTLAGQLMGQNHLFLMGVNSEPSRL